MPKKNKSISLSVFKDNRWRIIDYPVDLVGLFFGITAISLLSYLVAKYTGDPFFPKIAPDSLFFISLSVVGLLGYYIFYIVSILLKKKKGTQKKSGNLREQITDKSLYSLNPGGRDLFSFVFIDIIGCIACYMGIQILIQLLLGEGLFQVVAGDVYAFFISAAISEELIFRAFLCIVVQTLFSKIFQVQNKDKQKGKIYLVNIITASISGLLFMIGHVRYYGDIVAILITLIAGFSQALWFMYSKSMIPIMASHVFINILAAGTLLASL